MQLVLLVVALLSGLLTVVFIVMGLRQGFVRHKRLGLRMLLLTTIFSLLTGVCTIWQLVLVARQLRLPV